MNDSINSINESIIYISKDYWLSQFASSWFLDSFYVFIISPLGFIGFILNLLSFFVLQNKEFDNINIYSYFKVISINSALLNLMQASLISTSTFRYFEFSNSQEAISYATYIFLPVSNIFLLFGSTLDICISMDRCSIFIAKLKAIFKYPFKKVCLSLLIICILIDLPYFFVNMPSYYDAQLDANTTYRLWFWDITPFGKSLTGEILAYAGFFIRDVIFLVIELTFNILSVVLFRKYFKHKANFFKNNKNNKELTITTELECANTHGNISKNNTEVSQMNKLYIKEKNITLMVIILCCFSIITHLLYLIVTLYFFFYYDLIASGLAAFVFSISAFKNLSNFGLLYIFNFNFRKVFKKLIRQKFYKH